MTRKIQDPTTDKYGAEVHPAFGVAKVNTFSSSPPGATFFDSEIQHQHGVVLSVYRATRDRKVNHDWIHQTGLPLIEIEMSQAQWSALVSSFGNGSGVPVTVRSTETDHGVPGLPYNPRMALQLDETVSAAQRATESVLAALEEYKAADGAKNKRAALAHLEASVGNLPDNLRFAQASLSKHVETTVLRAKADIEAMVTSAHAAHLGLDPASYTGPLAIEPSAIVEGEVVGEQGEGTDDAV